jgi:hypothetical protein
MKTDHGGFAAIVWLIVGAILFYLEPEARLLSWQAGVFFIVGMLAAAGLLGGLSYLVTRGLTKLLIRTRVVTTQNRRTAVGLAMVGCLVFAAQAVLIYLVARWSIRAMF